LYIYGGIDISDKEVGADAIFCIDPREETPEWQRVPIQDPNKILPSML